jgi:hypothetical protein
MIGIVEQTLKTVELDEIELKLQLLKMHRPDLVNNDKTYKQIAESIQDHFNIKCDEFDINLLHEPTIDEMELDLQLHFQAMGLTYKNE